VIAVVLRVIKPPRLTRRITYGLVRRITTDNPTDNDNLRHKLVREDGDIWSSRQIFRECGGFCGSPREDQKAGLRNKRCYKSFVLGNDWAGSYGVSFLSFK